MRLSWALGLVLWLGMNGVGFAEVEDDDVNFDPSPTRFLYLEVGAYRIGTKKPAYWRFHIDSVSGLPVTLEGCRNTEGADRAIQESPLSIGVEFNTFAHRDMLLARVMVGDILRVYGAVWLDASLGNLGYSFDSKYPVKPGQFAHRNSLRREDWLYRGFLVRRKPFNDRSCF